MINKMKERFAAMKMSGKKGFTLIELVVVIAIMAILALIMVPNLTAYIKKADDSKIQANLKNIHTAAEMVSQTENSVVGDEEYIKSVANFTNLKVEDFTGTTATLDKYSFAEADGTITVTFKNKAGDYTFDGKKPVTP